MSLVPIVVEQTNRESDPTISFDAAEGKDHHAER